MMTGRTHIQSFLARLPLFSGLGETELACIAAGTSEVQVNRGDLVFRRGDPCVGFHAVVYGQIKLMFVSPTGDEKVVRLIGPGECFGEALMFMEKDYIVTAQALADTMLMHVGKAVIFGELERQPLFARKMLASLSQRLHALMSDVEAYSLRSGTQRVIGYLLKDQACESGQVVHLATSKTVIASRLNLTPEHFSRILRDLSNSGLISVNGRKVTIVDGARLLGHQG